MEKLDIGAIKNKVNIYDIVCQVIQLKRVGNKYMGLCPFHDEKTPSFYVTPSRQIFKCFGCGKGGDVIAFIQELNGLTFTEAIKTLSGESVNAETWRKSNEYQQPFPIPKLVEPTYINPITVRQSMQQYDKNHFIQFLQSVFQSDSAVLNDVIQRFSIGTAKGNNTVFWQRDMNGNFRTGQIMLYNPTTGKRSQDLNPTWTHTALKFSDFHLTQCFYGEYQLRHDSKPVAIVESAKTAAIMTPLDSRFTWLGSGGANGLTNEKCKALKGRDIVLYPDLGKFELWVNRAEELKKNLKSDVRVMNVLENYILTLSEVERAEQIKAGLDIADYALKFDWYNQVKQKKLTPLSKEQTILNAMIDRQPLVADLIKRLNLVSVSTLQPFCLT